MGQGHKTINVGGQELKSIVRFNVPLNTLLVISETILRVVRPTNSTEGWWLVNHVKGQFHQAQLTKK